MSTVMLAPKVNSNDETMLITKWLIEENEYVKLGQEIVRIETSKVDVTLSSNHNGYISRHGLEGSYINVNDVLASFSISPTEKNIAEIMHPETNSLNLYKLSNAAEKYVAENNINIAKFDLTGLVTLKDIKDLISGCDKHQDKPDNINYADFPRHTIENITSAKQQEITILERSYHQTLTSSITVQFESAQIREYLKKTPWLNNQILPYLLLHFARLCINYPKLTAYYFDNKIFYYNQVNLGLAIDLNKGLKIAVLRNAADLSLYDMHTNIIEHLSNYYNGELNIDAVTSSTITVTDLSSNGVFLFQPLLNDKQSAILGIGGDSELTGHPMTLTLAFDHRVLTGREVAEFLSKLKKAILSFNQF